MTFRRVSESLFSIFNYSCKSDDESAEPPREKKIDFLFKTAFIVVLEFDHIDRWYLRNLFNLLSFNAWRSIECTSSEIGNLVNFQLNREENKWDSIEALREPPHISLYISRYIFLEEFWKSLESLSIHTAKSSLTSLWKCQIAIAHIPWIFWCNRSLAEKKCGDLSCTGWITPLIEKQSKMWAFQGFTPQQSLSHD